MRRLLIGMTAGVLGVVGMAAAPSPASVRENHGGHHGGHSSGHHGGHSSGHYGGYNNYGHRFHGGYYYSSSYHPRWGGRVWDARCGRWHYWDPYLNVYYYYYSPGDCYYPITYCP